MPMYQVKKGYGLHVLRGKQYLPGQPFRADEYEVRNFLHKLEQVGPATKEKKEKKEENFNSLEISHVGGGWYEVLGEDGQPITSKRLRYHEAEKLVNK